MYTNTDNFLFLAPAARTSGALMLVQFINTITNAFQAGDAVVGSAQAMKYCKEVYLGSGSLDFVGKNGCGGSTVYKKLEDSATLRKEIEDGGGVIKSVTLHYSIIIIK